ncbi:pyridine nucleotide-disulfide oxidoreductase-domain-containing protein [Phascolomyces articulosus]|uniref:Pyridine nucleotide-disulfide oxidoreductase-domain-containing protein n=1 Tax=Phascolomyces articulosus TaxID=60185 RepID=A0AAD5KRS9_9FUNG|nr:pyridine nucleotide-disulfide oxidoreductase-domain-containing protein [Phascolomyces articulosus]
MTQDYLFLEEARGAHEQVHFLALHPGRGGAKNLPIVTHQLDDQVEDQEKPRLVIIGSGWGAVSVLRNLDKDKYNVTVISPNNYFLFTPLLPCATVGTNEPRSLLEPIRKIAARVRGHFLEAQAIDVDIENKLVEVKSTGSVINEDGTGEDHFYVPYDQLVLSVGATSITHGVSGLQNTHQLKTVQDAMAIRRKVMENVEKACLPTTTPEQRKQLLSFVCCGGGPTSVEFAAELFDWINEDLVKWFPKLLREDVSVTIIQSRDHILNMFDVQISEYAEKRFKRENINVITNARVQRIEGDRVVYKYKGNDHQEEEHSIPYGLCLWSTGIAMTPFVQSLSEKLGIQNHRRALLTDEFLRVKGVPDMSIFALGDCATIENPKLIEHIEEIFENADKNKDGQLNNEEFNTVITYIKKKFPLTRQHCEKLEERAFDKYDQDHSGTIEIQELGKFLRDIDRKVTQLPATAQVASQQGEYLAKYLTKEDNKNNPFIYRHLGTLAYLGNTAVGEFSWGYKMIGGLYSMYLWRSVYWSEQVSTRTRMNLSLDWTKRALFGRDISIV